jgi:hypothetical protein
MIAKLIVHGMWLGAVMLVVGIVCDIRVLMMVGGSVQTAAIIFMFIGIAYIFITRRKNDDA